jgi:hypothetical protein
MPTSAMDWEQVAEAAGEAFSIWVGQPELQWARAAWERLGRAGLTGCADELERSRAQVRFLALCGIYHDFCDVAWEESVEPE